VRIDEAGGDHASGRIELAVRVAAASTDGDDAPALDRDVAVPPRQP